jgi:hypothetical protein
MIDAGEIKFSEDRVALDGKVKVIARYERNAAINVDKTEATPEALASARRYCAWVLWRNIYGPEITDKLIRARQEVLAYMPHHKTEANELIGEVLDMLKGPDGAEARERVLKHLVR